MAQKIYLRRGLQSELDAIILEEGEPGWTTDTKMMYMGDGTTSGGLLVTASGIGVTKLEGLMGEITMAGYGGIAVSTEGQVIVVSGTVIEYVQSINSLHTDVTLSGLGTVSVSVDGQTIVISGEVFPENFVELDDTPSNYSGHADKIVSVDSGESGLEFVKSFIVHSTLDNNDYSGLTTRGVAGETLSFGDSVVVGGDSKWVKTSATSENRTDGHIGVVLASGVLNDNILLLLNGYIRNDSWTFNVGDSVYLSTTSGELTDSEPTTSGELVRIVGYARTASTLWYSPDNTFIKLKE